MPDATPSPVSHPTPALGGVAHRIFSENPMGLAALARALPAIDGKRRRPAQLWREATKGVRRGGRLYRLEHVRQGRRVVSSLPAYHRFLDAVTAASLEAEHSAGHVEDPKPVRPASARERAAQAAAAELAEAGI